MELHGLWIDRRRPDEEQQRARRHGEQTLSLTLLLIGQIGLTLLLGVLWWYLGGPWGPLVVGLCVAAVAASLVDWLALRWVPSEAGWSAVPWWFVGSGFAATLISWATVGGAAQLLWDNRWFGAAIFGVMYLVLFAIGRDPKKLGASSALLFIPVLLGWISASLGLGYLSPTNTVAAWYARAHHDGPSARPWIPEHCRSTAQPTRVAVALSGGGYRAAVTHAGLLAALDEQCVRIDLLTTVSGGSIIGAAYALGVPPVEFARQLTLRQPGLPTDKLLNAFALSGDLLDLSRHVSRDHFRRAFYGDTHLKDLPDTPLLLVNATDLEIDSYAAREVFFKGRAPAVRVDGKTLDETILVADVVAASGAYPGAFQPVSIPWPEPEATSPSPAVKSRRFVDGGVYENFGVEGLRRYLRLKRPDGTLPAKPHVLIISDASGYGTPGALAPRVDVVTLLSESQRVAYEVLHHDLYVRYTGVRQPLPTIAEQPVGRLTHLVLYARIDPELEGTPEALVSVAIPMTAIAMESALAQSRCVFQDDKTETAAAIQRRVRAFSTLAELSPLEVRQAFWLGYVIGTAYRPVITCARSRVAGEKCPEAPLKTWLQGDEPAGCPSYSDLLRRHDARVSTP